MATYDLDITQNIQTAEFYLQLMKEARTIGIGYRKLYALAQKLQTTDPGNESYQIAKIIANKRLDDLEIIEDRINQFKKNHKKEEPQFPALEQIIYTIRFG
ncbi:MAG: hypothetical protein ACP5N3_03060 [Candidatus Nanoarchaeia archaeon]